MAKKPKLDKTSAPVSAPPTWGDLAELSETVGVIRIECEDGAYAYSYHAPAC